MSSANSEQLKAIEHNGGVLLKAGAGSGKTFVLKEHMIYLTNKWISEYRSSQDRTEFDQFIKSKFSKIVLMTFTKKAAGELSIRLFNEFSMKAENSVAEDLEYWSIASEQLDYLTVTTIHGFCFKLIKQGVFTEIDLDDDIINSAQYDEVIRKIFDLWLETRLDKEQDHEFVDLIIKDKEQILESIKSIFSDPSLRQMWRKIEPGKISQAQVDQSIQDLVEIHHLNDFYEYEINLLAHDEFDGKNWYEFLKQFQKAKRSIEGLEDIVVLYEFFKNLDFKIPVTPRAKGVDENLKSYYVSVKELKDYLKVQGLDLYQFAQNFDGLVQGWFQKFYDIIQFVEVHYKNAPGITFSDLEYVVAKGLEDEKTAKAISEVYDYLIIDEFQDTSFIQFEIISKILNNDYSRLFCVGDIKQAIYGFRGGELGVFVNCEKLIPQVLSLKNNYRSDKDIIEFNNNFFDFLFERGLKYQGRDIKPVEVEYQEAPISERSRGKVYQINIEAGFLEKYDISTVSSAEVDYIESLALFSQILQLIEKDNKKVSVLYKKLKPSLLLIGLLIENNIGFTAQIKVPFGQDPILGIFKSLIEYEYNTNENRDQYLQLILTAYLGLINTEIKCDLQSLSMKFRKNTNYFGLFRAFYQFSSDLGLANSNYKNNLSYIRSICQLGKDDKEHIISILNSEESSSYSLDFQFGKNPNQIVIMTAHASKGLQFPHVLLGGIYTNDKSFPFTSLLGKFPMSFKWGETITSKQKYKTPQYLLESEVNKHKDFSESKRLFYVACTRAENSIGWVNINFEKIKKRTQSGAWSNGINTWLSESFKENSDIKSKLNTNTVNRSVDDVFSLKFLNDSTNRKPLFHIDSLGLTKKLNPADSLILPELSVTRLASLAVCARQFYLKNICKISELDLKLIVGEKVQLELIETDELSKKSFTSSAERGSLIHDTIDQVIKSDFNISISLTGRDLNSTTWAVDNLKKFRDNYEFISERTIKFELFKYMISGIPDLILFPKNNNHIAQVWDYKTGKRTESKEKPYKFQLMTYAYAIYEHYNYDKEKQINLVLCYVDDKNLVEQTVSFFDVEKYLEHYWSLINLPDKIDKESCEQCPYSNICHK